MNRSIMMAGLLLAASSAGIAVAQDAPPPPSAPGMPPPHHMMRLPSTRTEVQSIVRAQFAGLDVNHDGYLTQDELPMRRAAPAGRAGPGGLDRLFAMMDKNGDGAISKAEFDEFHAQHMHRWTKDETGPDGRRIHEEREIVTRDDAGMPPPGGHGMGGMHDMHGQMLAAMFRRADADHDGRVSLAEAEGAALARFDKADTDHDGVLSEAERDAEIQRLMERWHQHGESGGDMPPPPPGANTH